MRLRPGAPSPWERSMTGGAVDRILGKMNGVA